MSGAWCCTQMRRVRPAAAANNNNNNNNMRTQMDSPQSSVEGHETVPFATPSLRAGDSLIGTRSTRATSEEKRGTCNCHATTSQDNLCTNVL